MTSLKDFLRPRGDPAPLPDDIRGRVGRYSRWAAGAVDFVRRACRPVLAAALILTLASGAYAVLTLDINTDTAGMLSKDLPHRQRYADYKHAFPQFTDSLLIVLDGDSPDRADIAAAALLARLRAEPSFFRNINAIRNDPFFRRHGMLYLGVEELRDLSDRLADAQPLLTKLSQQPNLKGMFEVLGLALDEAAKGTKAPEGLPELIDRVASVAMSVGAGRPQPLSWAEALKGRDSEPADRRRFIQLQPRIDFKSLKPAARAMDRIREIAAELKLTPGNGVRVRLTGGAAMGTEELKSVASGASLAGLLSLGLVAALLILGLGSARMVGAVLLTLIAGLVWTAGFTALAIGHLNLISVAFAVLFIGLGVDFGIHFGLRYLEEARRGLAHPEALGRAAAALARPLGLCTAAAAVGFFSFVPTDYTGLSELGLIAGAGMFIALIASFTLLPALLTVWPPRVRTGAEGPDAASRFDSFVIRRGKPILAGVLGLAVVAALFLPFARFDADPIALKDPSTESVSTFLELMGDSDTAPYTIQVLAPDLAAAQMLATRLAALKSVDRTVTIGNFVPKKQAEKMEIIEATTVFMASLLSPSAPATPLTHAERRTAAAAMRARLKTITGAPGAGALREPAARLDLALGGLGTDPALLRGLEDSVIRFLPSRLDRLRDALRADRVALADLPADLRARYVAADGRARVQVFPKRNLSDPAALAEFVREVYTVAPAATDAPVQIREGGRAVAGAVRQATLTAFVLISLLLYGLLRSPRETFLVLMPLAIAAIFTVAASVLFRIPFNFANVIVLPLLLGLGVASSIHLVMRIREEGPDTALTRTSTPRAVVFSAMTTVFSFGTLSVSGHRGTASMGELLMLAIAFTLICALVFLPALMSWVRTEGVIYEAMARKWVATEGRELSERAARRLREETGELWRNTRHWAKSEGRGLAVSAAVWVRGAVPMALRAARDLARRLVRRGRNAGRRRRHNRPF